MRTLTKQTKILFLIVCSFFISCGIGSAYENFEPKNGITLVFYNYTDIEYTWL
ncbi:hypothetical protein PJW08_10350 [Tenacibaculum finnmarkense]|nr:hypothetical protein PJW08_10350 [Tenacibaculum finnmarkense]